MLPSRSRLSRGLRHALAVCLLGGALAANATPVTVDLPAQPLDAALRQLAARAGVTIAADSALLAGRQAPALRGTLEPLAALRALLAGSGLEASESGPGVYLVKRQTRAEASTLPAAKQSSHDATLLDTILVLGEKLPRSRFNTFSSVEVVTAEDLDNHVRQSLDEALNSSANIRVFERDGNSSISIRGFNPEGPIEPGRSSPVISVSVDGAEQSIEATRRGTRGVWDVEQIEVLRGPQSSLQGRNALAGALVVKTKDPTFTPEAIVRGAVDTDGLYSGAFAVSAPIIDEQLAFRISGQVARDDKDIKYEDSRYASLGDEEFEEFRGKLLFTPSGLPGFTGLFTVSRTHDKPAQNMVSGPDYFDRERRNIGNAEFRDTVVKRYIADLKYELNADWTIQSITSYVDTKVEIDALRTSSWFRDEIRDGEDLSQDVRLTYGSEESAFSGVLGLYAGRFSSHNQGISEIDLFGLGYTIPFQSIDSKSKSKSFAVYADGRYEFIDRWTLLAGGRLLHDKISLNQQGVVLPTVLNTPLDEVSSVSNTEFLPKLGLAFELSENQNIALTASKGYRSGFSEHIIGTTTINTVEPESLWAYELAYRSRWLDDRLQINGNVFYYDYTDMQVAVPVPGLLGEAYNYSINAGKAHAYGAELDARWNFGSGFEVFAGLGLLKTQFDSGTFAGTSLSGNEFSVAPAVTASFGGNYRHHSGFFAGGDVSFTDGFYSHGEVRNRSAYAVGSFTVVNAQAGWQIGHFTLTAYAKNLLDEKYLTGIGSSGTIANVGDARTFGLEVTARF